MTTRRFDVPARVVERVRTKVTVDESTGCLISTYSTGSHGYAQVGWVEDGERTITLAHRVAWIGDHGPIPDGMTVDHTCKRRKCVNVAHLRLLTNYENARRTSGRDWPIGQCINGHPTEGEPRRCPECNRDAQARYRDKKRAA